MTPAIHAWLSRAIVCTAVLGALMLALISQHAGAPPAPRLDLAKGKATAQQTQVLLAEQQTSAK
jgi:hypothetical protein